MDYSLAHGVNSAYANTRAYDGGTFSTDTTLPQNVNSHAMVGISNNVAAANASHKGGSRRRSRSRRRRSRRSRHSYRSYSRSRRHKRRYRGGCGCNAALTTVGGRRSRRSRGGTNIPANIGYSIVPASGSTLAVDRAMANPVNIRPFNYAA